MPSQRNHVGAGVIDGKFYVVAGRLGAGFIDDWIHLPGGGTSTGGSSGSTIHQVYRPTVHCLAPAQLLDLAVQASTGGGAEVSALAPSSPVGSTWELEFLRVDIVHDGHDLRAAPGMTPAEQLQDSLCSLGPLGTFAPGAAVAVTDVSTTLLSDEVVGYLLRADDGTGESARVSACAP